MGEKLNSNSSTLSASNSVISPYGETESKHRWQNFKDSFKQAKKPEYEQLDEDSLTEIQRINIKTATSLLQRELKPRHLQMIAIASSIGTGLFIGSGSALSTGGPGGILIAWVLTGSAILCTMQALIELSVTFPISGSFNVYASRFIDPSVGFSVAWNYVFQYLTLLPLELVAASITIQYWNTSINPDVWVAIFYLVVIAINFFGVRAYGEAEFIFSSIKVLAVVGFIIVSIVLAAGGGPTGNYVGAKYWHDPGAFSNGFKGVASVFVTAAFSFAGTELVGLTAAEAKNPRHALPKATKQVFWRILMFYVVSLTLIAFLVPYNDPRLMNGSSSVDISASPFVIAINNGGIKVLPSIMNVVILISVISVGSSCVYATTRTVTSLAEQGLAPLFLGYIDRKGRPIIAIVITNIFGLLAFIAASHKQNAVFTWLLSISGLSAIFTWLSINIAHLRFRRALKVQGRSTEELIYSSQTGVIGSIYAACLNILVLIVTFWEAVWPLGSKPNAEAFFEVYLGFVILIIFYVGHKIYRRNWVLFIRAKDIDIDSGRRELDLEALKEELAEERAILAAKPLYYRIYQFWC